MKRLNVLLAIGFVALAAYLVVMDKKNDGIEEDVKNTNNNIIKLYYYANAEASIRGVNEDLEELEVINNIYKASDGFDLYEDDLYYFSSEYKLNKYNIKSKDNVELNMSISNYNANMVLQAYGKYVFVYDPGYSFYVYDIEKDEFSEIGIEISNTSFTFDEDENNLYYINKNRLYVYNLDNKKSTKVLNDARPLKIVDGVLLYSNLDDSKYFEYNLESKKSKSITKIEYEIKSNNGSAYIGVDNEIRKYENDKNELIVKLNEDEEVIIVEKVGNYLVIGSTVEDSESWIGVSFKYYIYDMKNDKIRPVEGEEERKVLGILS